MLSVEENKLIAKMHRDKAGTVLITAIKEFDHYYYNLLGRDQSQQTGHPFHIMQLGLPRLIVGTLGAIPRFKYPVITFQSDQPLIRACQKTPSGG